MNLARLPVWLRRPTPLEVASRELANAQIDLMGAEAHAEAYAAHVKALQQRVTRLRTRVADLSQEGQPK